MLTKRQKIHKNFKFLLQKFKFENNSKEKSIIFIFGAQRSGTNMLADSFDKCFSVSVYHEEDEDSFYDYRIKNSVVIKKIIDKSPFFHIVFKPICDSQKAEELLSEYDNSKAIWIYRNWEDVVNSAMKSFPNGYEELENIVRSPDSGGWRGENLTEENKELVEKFVSEKISDVSSRALFWYLRNFQYFQQKLYENSRVYLVKYEDLVTNPHKILKNVFEFSNIPFKTEYSKFIHIKSINKNSAPDIDKRIKDLNINLSEKLDQYVYK